MIIQMAQILKDQCRTTDIVGRYGGEEFIVIMPDTIDIDAATLFSRIQHQVDEVDFKNGIHGHSQLWYQRAAWRIRSWYFESIRFDVISGKRKREKSSRSISVQ